MRSLLLGTCIVLVLWGAAVAAYFATGKEHSVGLIAVGSLVIIQLQLVWLALAIGLIELRRGRMNRRNAEAYVEASRLQ